MLLYIHLMTSDSNLTVSVFQNICKNDKKSGIDKGFGELVSKEWNSAGH